jgi:histidinol-phosphatase
MPGGWRTLAGRAWAERSFSDFWQYCLVAEGSVDVAADELLQLWDYAAVQLIVNEAGGRCSTLSGDPASPGNSFLATNGLLHEEAIATLRDQSA